MRLDAHGVQKPAKQWCKRRVAVLEARSSQSFGLWNDPYQSTLRSINAQLQTSRCVTALSIQNSMSVLRTCRHNQRGTDQRLHHSRSVTLCDASN